MVFLEEGGGGAAIRVPTNMDATRLSEILIDMLNEQIADLDDAGFPMSELSCASVETFADADVLADDPGFVVTLSDGSEFQITVVQTRR